MQHRYWAFCSFEPESSVDGTASPAGLARAGWVRFSRAVKGQAPQKEVHTVGSCNALSGICYSFFASFNTHFPFLLFTTKMEIVSVLQGWKVKLCAWHVFRDCTLIARLLNTWKENGIGPNAAFLTQREWRNGWNGNHQHRVKKCRDWWTPGYTWEVKKSMWQRLIILRWNESCPIKALSSER